MTTVVMVAEAAAQRGGRDVPRRRNQEWMDLSLGIARRDMGPPLRCHARFLSKPWFGSTLQALRPVKKRGVQKKVRHM